MRLAHRPTSFALGSLDQGLTTHFSSFSVTLTKPASTSWRLVRAESTRALRPLFSRPFKNSLHQFAKSDGSGVLPLGSHFGVKLISLCSIQPPGERCLER